MSAVAEHLPCLTCGVMSDEDRELCERCEQGELFMRSQQAVDDFRNLLATIEASKDAGRDHGFTLHCLEKKVRGLLLTVQRVKR